MSYEDLTNVISFILLDIFQFYLFRYNDLFRYDNCIFDITASENFYFLRFQTLFRELD